MSSIPAGNLVLERAHGGRAEAGAEAGAGAEAEVKVESGKGKVERWIPASASAPASASGFHAATPYADCFLIRGLRDLQGHSLPKVQHPNPHSGPHGLHERYFAHKDTRYNKNFGIPYAANTQANQHRSGPRPGIAD